MTPNEQLLDSSIKASLRALRFAESARSEVVGLFESMLDRARSLILTADIEQNDSRSVEALVVLLAAMIDDYYEEMETQLERLLLPFVSLYAADVAEYMSDALELPVSPLPALQESRLVASSLVLGGPRTEYFADQALRSKRSTARELRLAVAANVPASAIVDRIVGTKTGRRLSVLELGGGKSRVAARTGGVLAPSRNAMNSLVRTSVSSIVSEIVQSLVARNQDQIRGLAAITTLDGRTSKICISRSGGAWDPDSGKPLPESTVQSGFPGYPPWHLNCRTFLAPVAAGDVAPQPTYPEWLESQPKAFQREVLGPSRYTLWKAGKLDLHRLIDPSGRPLSLKDLASKS